MRRYVDGKEFVLMDDILFIKKSTTSYLPASISKKILGADFTKMGINDDLYVELTTEAEKDFINNINYIYNKNYLDILSAFQLRNEVDELIKEIEKKSGSKDLLEETEHLKYKFNSLLEYLNERIVNCCDTCENRDCEVELSNRIGLDKNGYPVGHDCQNYMNTLKKFKKYTLN